jgi:hypothetical protein
MNRTEEYRFQRGCNKLSDCPGRLIQPYATNEVVWYTLSFMDWHFVGDYRESFVHLHRVSIDDFSIKSLGQFNRKLGETCQDILPSFRSVSLEFLRLIFQFPSRRRLR